MKLFKHPISVLTFLIGLIFSVTPIKAQQLEYLEEVRGVWITNVASNVLHSKQKLADAMDYLAANGINVVFPVVWNKGETQYPSTIMQAEFNRPMEQLFVNQGRDPLAELIVEAHRNGIEVMPWFEFGFATSFSQDGGHIIAKYPHWAARNSSGQLVVKNGFDWMNGIHPEVQDFMLSLIREVIENYDVDGVQGDDRLPAMPVEGGYDAYTVSLYQSKHNGANPPTNVQDTNWKFWRSDQLVNFLGRWYRMIKEHDQNLIMSLSPSNYPFGFNEYLQETPLWLDSAYVDMVHPQLYPPVRTLSNYQNLVHSVVGPVPNSSGGWMPRRHRDKLTPGLLVKVGNENVAPGIVTNMVSYNRQFGINGEVYFFYEGMWDKNQFLADTLSKYHYSNPAVLPVRQGYIRRPKGIVVNETDAGAQRTGNWQIITTSLNPPGYDGRSLSAQPGHGAAITYYMEVPWSAHYRVYAYISQTTEATTGARYTVFYNDGQDSVTTVVNQTLPVNRGWLPIGNVYLPQGTQPVVRLSADDVPDGKPTFADAVMLILDRKQSPDVMIPIPTSVNRELGGQLPEYVRLEQNFPNPFNPSTNIRFTLPYGMPVALDIYDLTGRKVTTLLDSFLTSGEHNIRFDAGGLASGIYLYRISTDLGIQTRTMILLK